MTSHLFLFQQEVLCDRPSQCVDELMKCDKPVLDYVIQALEMQDSRHLANRLTAELQAVRDKLEVILSTFLHFPSTPTTVCTLIFFGALRITIHPLTKIKLFYVQNLVVR